MAANDATIYNVYHLVRLCGLKKATLNGKVARVIDPLDTTTGKFNVVILDDRSRPYFPVLPERMVMIEPKHMQHVCEYCLAVAADGKKLLMCGRCKTARYCNAECQRADWGRHKSPDCIQFSHKRGWDTALQQACMNNDVAEVRRLVEEEGADIDKATSNGPTPLYTAAMSSHLDVVRYLVEKGADKDKARATSMTPMCIAASKGFMHIVQYLVEQGADKDKAAIGGVTPLFMAAQEGILAMVRYLVEQGADKNKPSSDGSTPLCMAAGMGRVAVVRCLVEHGADMDAKAMGTVTPMMAAFSRGHFEVVTYLAESGATLTFAR
jgi:ankyrin repeat protein